MLQSSLDTTFTLLEGALKEANLSARDIDVVLLVGDTYRIPSLQSRIEELFGRSALWMDHNNPVFTVATGAAIQGSILSDMYREDGCCSGCCHYARHPMMDIADTTLGLNCSLLSKYRTDCKI